MLGRRIRWGWKWTKSALLDGEVTDESQERASEQGASGATSWRQVERTYTAKPQRIEELPGGL